MNKNTNLFNDVDVFLARAGDRRHGLDSIACTRRCWSRSQRNVMIDCALEWLGNSSGCPSRFSLTQCGISDHAGA